MKRVFMVIVIALLIVAVGTAGFCIAFPQIAEQAVHRINGIFQEPTQPVTKPPATKPITATKPPIESISASVESKTLEVGKTEQIKTVVTGSAASQSSVRFISSDENIASVDLKGTVTAKSQGQCEITAYVEGFDNIKETIKFNITDDRIDQINILNNYLQSLKMSESFKYGNNKTANVRVAQCKIDDFGGYGQYDMYIIRKITDDIKLAEIVRVSGAAAVSYKNSSDYAQIAKAGYTSYVESIYTDASGNPCVILEYRKDSDKTYEKTAELYGISGGKLVKSLTLSCTEPQEVNSEKGKYKQDGKEITKDKYVEAYTNLKKNHTLYDDYSSAMVSIGESKIIKAELPVNLEDTYFKRVKWSTSDESVAKVSESGVITGVTRGECTITGKLDCFSKEIAKITVSVADVADEFNSYLSEIKNKSITGENGVTMKLYGYRTLDVDGDDQKELFLYYTGSNSCQIDVVTMLGSQIKRSVAINRSTEKGTVCMFDFYSDSMTNTTVLYEGYTSTKDGKENVEFHYNSYEGKKFKENTSEFKIVADKSNSKNTVYYVGGEKVSEESFTGVLARYSRLGEWQTVE